MNKEWIDKMDFSIFMKRAIYYKMLYNKTADEMLDDYGFEKEDENDNKIIYKKYWVHNSADYDKLLFDKRFQTISLERVSFYKGKEISTYTSMTIELVDAILMKCAELGWTF